MLVVVTHLGKYLYYNLFGRQKHKELYGTKVMVFNPFSDVFEIRKK